MTKYLGKIKEVYFGLGGYNEAMLGIHLTFSFNGKEVCFTEGGWDYNRIKHSEHSKWIEEDRKNDYYEAMIYISDLLKQCNVTDIKDLKNKPVEVEILDNSLKSWRILTEVL